MLWRHEKLACRLASEFGVGRGVLELILCHGGCDGFLGIHDTGNVWTASAHVITAVIGSGVLSLAWSIAQMGWLMGPVVLLLFAVVTYFTSMLLADSYRHPDPVTGKRNYTYMDTVRANLGESTDSIDTSFPRPPACVHEHSPFSVCSAYRSVGSLQVGCGGLAYFVVYEVCYCM